MKNLTMSKKLGTTFMLLINLTIIVAVIGGYGMNYINNAAANLYKYNLLAVDAAGSIMENYSSQRGDLFCLVLYDAASEEFKQVKERIERLESEMETYISNYTLTINEEYDRVQFNEFKDIYYGDFKNLKEQLVTLGTANENEQVLTIINTTGEEVISKLGNTLEQCYQNNLDLSEKSLNNNAFMFRRFLFSEILYTTIAAIIAALLARYITKLTSNPSIFIRDILQRIGIEGNLGLSSEERKIAKEYSSHKDEAGQSVKMLLATVDRLEAVSNTLETVARGDLTVDLSLLSDKDTIGYSLKKMTEDLNNMFSEIHNSALQVAAGARQLTDGSQILSQGSSEQAAAIEEVSSSVTEVTTKTKYTSDMAKQASQLASSIKDDAEKGNNHMEAMLIAVKEINEAGDNINKVIKVIDDIAFQTNILALNASVEAARAGQHGKGFAIVAEEVRNLASKSAEAAKDTSELIATSIEKAELGARIANETAESLSHIVVGINESADIIVNIAESSEEQATTISQINSVINQVADVVQQNSATAQESAAASEEMSGQSDTLEELISNFKIKDQM